MSGKTLEVRLFDGVLTPETVHASDLAFILNHLDAAVKCLVDEDDGNPVVLALTGVEPGSCDLRFWVPSVSQDAILRIKRFLNRPQSQTLPPKAHAKLYELSTFLVKRNWSAEFRGVDRSVARMTPSNPLPRSPQLRVRNGITLVGKCLELGGSKPHIGIKPVSGGPAVEVSASEELVKEIAHNGRLYQIIALYGQASWDPATELMTSFKVEKILPYRVGQAAEGARRLAVLTGQFWSGINADQHLLELNGEDS